MNEFSVFMVDVVVVDDDYDFNVFVVNDLNVFVVNDLNVVAVVNHFNVVKLLLIRYIIYVVK